MARKLLPESQPWCQCEELVTTYQERSDHLRDPRIVVKKIHQQSKFSTKNFFYNFYRHICYVNHVASNYIGN